jgi:outer membrane receptor protein involved in Fe transport
LAYGTQPNFGVDRNWPFKKLLLKADLLMFSAPKYIEKGGAHDFTGNASDLSLGAEFTINRQFSAWLNANNLFNNKYERWHNYPVYGLNVLGGIIVRF